MPVTPIDAEKAFNEKHRGVYDKAVAHIDQVLLSDFTGSNTVSVFCDGYMHTKIVRKIELAYSVAGWDVSYRAINDPRPGESGGRFEFKRKPHSCTDPTCSSCGSYSAYR